MKKENDSSTDEESVENNLNIYTLQNIENYALKEYPTLPLYEYPEPNLDTLSPICYSTVQKPELKLELYHEETLFYIFYTYTETSAQIKAYNLLIAKGYSFSTIYKCFMLYTGKKIVDNANRKIVIFDPFYWKKIEKNVVFDKNFVDSIKGIVEFK
ncbi:hypothetical protein VCUG_00034 [Vavraia culicis subsp. floridensis]|uniref:NOT2/NOT3/NOT5 C-terminal domain-containing protein n=1 Tax=Vavraia culicis (isolate floridensis) TaxID=948595 RepID=L2GZD0_VAVCU|nr:uncharacterized protein VCUG_00034 [Vavraia culicis subsp. floridensis]ELA48425.1 hypothetical protein VCUG_00034 [Vavraia culicis subsp. floridensis]